MTNEIKGLPAMAQVDDDTKQQLGADNMHEYRLKNFHALVDLSWELQKYIPEVRGSVNTEKVRASIITGSADTSLGALEEEYKLLTPVIDAYEQAVDATMVAMQWKKEALLDPMYDPDRVQATANMDAQRDAHELLATAIYDETLRRMKARGLLSEEILQAIERGPRGVDLESKG